MNLHSFGSSSFPLVMSLAIDFSYCSFFYSTLVESCVVVSGYCLDSLRPPHISLCTALGNHRQSSIDRTWRSHFLSCQSRPPLFWYYHHSSSALGSQLRQMAAYAIRKTSQTYSPNHSQTVQPEFSMPRWPSFLSPSSQLAA